MAKALRLAAQEALKAHDALRATRQTEPPSGEDGLPLNPTAWLAWRENESKPAYARWSAAMDALAEALGEPKMSRHPFDFRPRCEAILTDG